MKYSVLIFLLIGLVSCKKEPEIALKDRVYDFKVSECRYDCGRDSVGVRENRLVEEDLKVRLGYVVNCSWSSAWVDNVEHSNDTLYVELDREHTKTVTYEEGGDFVTQLEYPMTDCDCFYFFEFKIKDVRTPPQVVRVAATMERSEYWDQRPHRIYSTPEEVEIEEVFPED